MIFSANNFLFFSSENVLNLTTIGTSNLQKNSGRDLSLFLLYHLFLCVSLCLGFCLGFLSFFVFHSFSLFFTLYLVCFLFYIFLILWVSYCLRFLLSTFLTVYVSYSLCSLLPVSYACLSLSLCLILLLFVMRFFWSMFLAPCVSLCLLCPACLFLSASFFYFL